MADVMTTTAQRSDEAAPRRLSPKVRRLLREHGLEVGDVRPSGSGRVRVTDVERVLDDRRGTGRTAKRAEAARTPDAAVASPVRRGLREKAVEPDEVVGTGAPIGRTETVELSRTRRVIAERMHASLQTTAQLTAVVEVDMTRLMTDRARVRDQVQQRTGVPLTPLAPIAHAVCRVLARHPVLNASVDVDDGTATFHRDVDLGIAVDTEHGLMVPTIEAANDLTAIALSERIADLAARSRSRDLAPHEVSGGTFTITNTGSRGVMLDTPILDPPQVGILATTLIEKRPVVVTDEFGGDTLAIRQMSYMCLTYDHRLVDGADAARFLTDLKHELETSVLLTGTV